jgi:hypothetical protein
MPRERRVWAAGAERVATGAEPMDMDEQAVEGEAAEKEMVEEEMVT